MSARRRLLYYCPVPLGGIADYAHEQAKALARLGLEVTMLCPEDFCHASDEYIQHRELESARAGNVSRFRRRLKFVSDTLSNISKLDRFIAREKFREVLCATYSEYLAPLWAWRLRRHVRRGVIFGAVAHDPVRDYVLGPLWWHQASIASGYSFLREAFVHEEIPLDGSRSSPNLKTTVIPHGPYKFPVSSESPTATKSRLGIPVDAKVALSFGHIRDAKNLDLILRAMTDIPDLFLIVAGKEQSSNQKPLIFYQKLSEQLGIQDRCRWIHGHVPDTDVAALFGACDVVLLTYSKAFRSASGVLSAAVNYRKPCLASSGGGNLETVVKKYGLGVFVEPDNRDALCAGMISALGAPSNALWDEYLCDHSWNRNATLVQSRIFATKQPRSVESSNGFPNLA